MTVYTSADAIREGRSNALRHMVPGLGDDTSVCGAFLGLNFSKVGPVKGKENRVVCVNGC